MLCAYMIVSVGFLSWCIFVSSMRVSIPVFWKSFLRWEVYFHIMCRFELQLMYVFCHLQGGSASGVTLTAYVTITLLEMRSIEGVSLVLVHLLIKVL